MKKTKLPTFLLLDRDKPQSLEDLKVYFGVAYIQNNILYFSREFHVWHGFGPSAFPYYFEAKIPLKGVKKIEFVLDEYFGRPGLFVNDKRVPFLCITPWSVGAQNRPIVEHIPDLNNEEEV